MARISPARPKGLDPVLRLTNAYMKRMYGEVAEPAEVLGHHTPLLLGIGTVAMASERFARSVDERVKSLAMLRVSQLIECEWCLDFGSRLAQSSGASEEQLRELSTWRSSERFSSAERLVLEYAEGMTRTPVEVSDELFTRLQEHFDERQMIELTMAISLENLYSRTNAALGIESQGYAEGMYCVRPAAVPDAVAGHADAGAPV
jgi:AhpD family alkylhydroperoxidase